MAKAVSDLVRGATKTTTTAAADIANAGVGLAKTGVKTAVGVANTGAKAVTKVANTSVNAVTKVANKGVDTVTKVANKGVDTVAKVASTGVNAVTKVANKGVDIVTAPISAVGDAASNTSKGVSKVTSKLEGLCNPESIIPCITALTLIAYIVIVSPSSVLDVFSNKWGKALSMAVVLIALLFDLKMGVMLGLAVVLSIALASVNKDLYESFSDAVPAEMELTYTDGEVDTYTLNKVDTSGNGRGIRKAARSVMEEGVVSVKQQDESDVTESFKSSSGNCYKPFKRSACKEKPNCFKKYKQKTCKEILGVPKGSEIVPVVAWSGAYDDKFAPVLQIQS